MLYPLQEHTVHQDEDLEHVGDRLLGGKHLRKIVVVLRDL